MSTNVTKASKVVKVVSQEDDLLMDLNYIADYAIGNQAPVDVSFHERDTLPESLAYAMTYPTEIKATRDAKEKMKKLVDMVVKLQHKVDIMHTKNTLRKANYGKE